MFERIQSATPFVKPFPPFDDVFNEPLALHRKHFLPLVSVDVSVIHDDLDLWLHFVMPFEPLLELEVGYFTHEYHDVYNCEGQFAFRVVDGKYTFAGDFNYFAFESGAIFKAFPDKKDEILADYRTRHTSYEESREGFLRYGRIPWTASSQFDPDGNRPCGPLVSQLGGEPAPGNWPDIPTNRNGKALRYIGEVQGFSYCEGGIQALLLFYDPDEQMVVFRTEWT